MSAHDPAALLAVHSLEGFLSRTEVGRVLRRITALRAAHPDASFQAGADGKSVHHLHPFGLDAASAARVFSPAGRVEIALGGVLPELVDLLERAFYRRIEDIQRVYPAAVWPVGWTYVEYAPGQHCTSHADGSFGGSQVGALSVRLDEGTEGGEFYVETSGSEQLWTSQEQSRDLIVSALYRNQWLDRLPKTRWLAQPARGTGLLWGAHLIHGSQAVRRGISKKIIAWIEGA